MELALIVAGALSIILGLSAIKKAKGDLISILLTLVLLFGGLFFLFIGFFKLNEVPHTYTVEKNAEISTGNYQVQLKEGDKKIVLLPSLTEEQAQNFVVGETIELTNNDIKKYTE